MSLQKKIFREILRNEKIQEFVRKLREYDKETYKHAKRTCKLCIKLGYKNNLSLKEIKLIGTAGLLHDLGKTAIPREILLKETCLNEEEKRKIKEHVRKGFFELKGKEFEDIKKIIIGHHEQCTCPYPRCKERRKNSREKERRKNNSNVCKFSQMLAATDLYDALISERPYKKHFIKRKVREIMEKEFKGDKIYIKQLIK